MPNSFDRLIVDRLIADGNENESWSWLVLAACEGPDALAGALTGESMPGRPDVSTTDPAAVVEPPGAYLRSISVEGFRGIAARSSLQLTPSPGLTLVVGRNGSGKSSFAEALELLLTGANKRWDGRSSVWSDGWRSLHQPHPCAIQSEFAVERMGIVTVARTWEEGAPLDRSAVWYQAKGKERRPFAELGWDVAIKTHRPFLPYSELGTLLDKPSDVYDALADVLGLDDLLAAQRSLHSARKAAQARVDAVSDRLNAVLPKLQAVADRSGDARASICREALHGRKRDLASLEAVLGSDHGVAGDPAVALLRRTHVSAPTAEAVERAARALIDAANDVDKTVTTDAGRARALAQLLEQALRYYEAHPAARCPVCGAPDRLADEWHRETAKQVSSLRLEASVAERSHRALQDAIEAARRLLSLPATSLQELEALGLQSAATVFRAVERWNAGASLGDARALSAHLSGEVGALRQAVEALQAEVLAELARREDLWQPVAADLRAWVTDARAAETAQAQVALLRKAENWIKDVQADVREQRFQPIAEQAIAIWNQLRQNSNVALGSVQLQGANTQRRVVLGVTVDGVSGAALSVMSQGELNALALSLFMPRASLAESPFRFMVIDDPVQSMDPSRVDGLARALDNAAKRRQVVVFTHDDRLPESVRRLGIAASVIAVTRRPGSLVEVRPALTPVHGYIQDAHTIRLTRELPDEVKRRVLPGFCRSAIEAACMEAIRARRLKRGELHADVERQIAEQRTLTRLMALTLFDDEERGGDVLRALNNRWSEWAADAFRAINRGAHDAHTGDLETLARHSEQLAARLRELP